MMVYGYCRISTKQQSIERQVRNILAEYPKARLYNEACSWQVFPVIPTLSTNEG